MGTDLRRHPGLGPLPCPLFMGGLCWEADVAGDILKRKATHHVVIHMTRAGWHDRVKAHGSGKPQLPARVVRVEARPDSKATTDLLTNIPLESHLAQLQSFKTIIHPHK